MQRTAAGGGRRRRGVSERCRMVEAFNVSGLGTTEFCRKYGLSSESLNRWRREYDAIVRAPVTTEAEHSVPFIDLGSLGAATVPVGGRLDLRLELGGGLVLHLVRG